MYDTPILGVCKLIFFGSEKHEGVKVVVVFFFTVFILFLGSKLLGKHVPNKLESLQLDEVMSQAFEGILQA